jgi:hypothetical protein
LEYQYFFFKKSYSQGGIQYNPNYPGRSFMDAIWDAIKVTGTVNVRSSGNNDWSNPYYRPAYPLFNPWAERPVRSRRGGATAHCGQSRILEAVRVQRGGARQMVDRVHAFKQRSYHEQR